MNQPLQEYINHFVETTPEKMLYREPGIEQMLFVRDYLVSLVGAGLSHNAWQEITTVISTHRSKSIDLPVYQLSRPDLGLTIFLRNNFYNWKMSVISARPLVFNLAGLCHTTSPIEPDYTGDPLHPIYFEGFPTVLVFGYYDESDRCKFSAEIDGNHKMWSALFNMMFSLGQIKPLKWNTRESHQAELAREYGKVNG